MNKMRSMLAAALAVSCITTLAPAAMAKTIEGEASWYGPGFDGRQTASGEIFDQDEMTAAHKTLPFGTQVRVTYEGTGESVVVRINDRGPYAHGRVIDLSRAAADDIGLLDAGTGDVTLEVVGQA